MGLVLPTWDWCAAQTLESREILEASGIPGRIPPPFSAPRACPIRPQSCREAGSNGARHGRRLCLRARLEQRTCANDHLIFCCAVAQLRIAQSAGTESVDFACTPLLPDM